LKRSAAFRIAHANRWGRAHALAGACLSPLVLNPDKTFRSRTESPVADRTAITGSVLLSLHIKDRFRRSSARSSIGCAQVAFQGIDELSVRFSSGEPLLFAACAVAHFCVDVLKKSHAADVNLIDARYAVKVTTSACFAASRADSSGGREALALLQRCPQD
jgi:hypothetical protein